MREWLKMHIKLELAKAIEELDIKRAFMLKNKLAELAAQEKTEKKEAV